MADTADEMSQENVEVVREAIGSFNAFMRGELTPEAAAEPLDPQIELSWHEERLIPFLPERVRGAAELIGYAEQRRTVDLTLEPVEVVEAPDDRVVTRIIQRIGGSGGGAPFESHFFYVWAIEDGRVHRVEIYLRRDDALAAVGLEQ